MSFYDTHIISVLGAFDDEPFSLRAVIDKLSDIIVDSYNGDVFSNYKRDWNQAVVDYFKANEIELLKTKPSWDNIAASVVDRLVANDYDFQKQPSKSSNRNPAQGSSSGDVSSGASLKQQKLNAKDKDNIKAMYDSLNKAKMWKLSTGTLVEEKMLEHAMKQEYEHLCHSLTFHVEDDCWNDYFSQEEINEIKNTDAVKLPLLPVDIKTYIEQLEVTPKETFGQSTIDQCRSCQRISQVRCFAYFHKLHENIEAAKANDPNFKDFLSKLKTKLELKSAAQVSKLRRKAKRVNELVNTVGNVPGAYVLGMYITVHCLENEKDENWKQMIAAILDNTEYLAFTLTLTLGIDGVTPLLL